MTYVDNCPKWNLRRVAAFFQFFIPFSLNMVPNRWCIFLIYTLKDLPFYCALTSCTFCHFGIAPLPSSHLHWWFGVAWQFSKRCSNPNAKMSSGIQAQSRNFSCSHWTIADKQSTMLRQMAATAARDYILWLEISPTNCSKGDSRSPYQHLALNIFSTLSGLLKSGHQVAIR